MAATKDETAVQVIVDPETGELIEVNLEGAEAASAADVREAKKLHQIEGPFAVLGVKILDGKTFNDEYAELLIAQKKNSVELVVTASAEVIGSLKRAMARGLATPAKPLLTKATSVKTSKGFNAHKLQTLTPEEDAGLRAALRGQ